MRFPACAAAFALASIPAVALADRVTLKNGTTVDGEITEQKPGAFVVMKLEGGRERTFVWSDVDSFSAGGKTTSTSVAAPAASTSTPGPAAAPAPIAKPTDDCATSTDVRCASTSTSGPDGGLGVGMTRERVVHLKQPGSSYVVMAIDGGVLFGRSTKGADVTIIGGGANFNLQLRAGQKFPGVQGGSWSGVGVDLTAGIFGAGVLIDHGNDGAGFLMTNGGAVLGYQFFHFGAMDEGDFTQSGVGFFVGGRVGGANIHVFSQGPTQSSSDFQYGPEIQLTFPGYNFGTAKREAFYISAYALPTGDFFLANIQLGGSFSL